MQGGRDADRLIVTIDEHRPVAHVVLERMWLVNASGEPFSEATRGKPLPFHHHRHQTRCVCRLKLSTKLQWHGRTSSRGQSALYAEVGLDNRWPIAECVEAAII